MTACILFVHEGDQSFCHEILKRVTQTLEVVHMGGRNVGDDWLSGRLSELCRRPLCE